MAQGQTPREAELLDVQVDDDGMSFAEMLFILKRNALLVLAVPLLVAAAAAGITYAIAPTFTAVTTFLPPQQGQSSAASLVASLGPLASLAGGVSGIRSSGDQYVALMQSVSATDRIIDKFDLIKRYEAKFRQDARKKLGENVHIGLGKKDGLITVQVDDHNPQVAADIANQYVEELRTMTSSLAVTEAQQRRAFFEQLMEQTRHKLTDAQQALQASGFNPGALKAEPKAAAESYANLKAEVKGAEIKLQALRGSLTDAAPEVRQQLTILLALRQQLTQVERASLSPQPASGPDYVGRYRDFKYLETLFELYARQFELARVDESREGTLIQVVDVAQPPERKSKPQRGMVAALAALGALTLVFGYLMVKQSLAKAPALQ